MTGRIIQFPGPRETIGPTSREIDSDRAFRTAVSQQVRVADVIAALQAGLMHYGNLPDAVNFLCFDLVGCQLPEAIKRFQAFAAEASAGGAGAPFADNHPDDADDEPV